VVVTDRHARVFGDAIALLETKSELCLRNDVAAVRSGPQPANSSLVAHVRRWRRHFLTKQENKRPRQTKTKPDEAFFHQKVQRI
jgi:hypothetical protein